MRPICWLGRRGRRGPLRWRNDGDVTDMRKLVGRNFARLRRERGARNPTIVTLYELAQALEVDVLALVTPDGV